MIRVHRHSLKTPPGGAPKFRLYVRIQDRKTAAGANAEVPHLEKSGGMRMLKAATGMLRFLALTIYNNQLPFDDDERNLHNGTCIDLIDDMRRWYRIIPPSLHPQVYADSI